MPKDSNSIKNNLVENTTGVATVSTPEVGHNIQMPLGATPPKGNEYRKKNEKEARRIKTFKEWRA